MVVFNCDTMLSLCFIFMRCLNLQPFPADVIPVGMCLNSFTLYYKAEDVSELLHYTYIKYYKTLKNWDEEQSRESLHIRFGSIDTD